MPAAVVAQDTVVVPTVLAEQHLKVVVLVEEVII
jgi:hypothetical protein